MLLFEWTAGFVRSRCCCAIGPSLRPGVDKEVGLRRLDRNRGRLSLRDLISRARAPAPHRQKLMNMTEKLRGAMRRMCGSVAESPEAETKRRTLALPSILKTTDRGRRAAQANPQPAALCRNADRAQGDQHHQGPGGGHALANPAEECAVAGEMPRRRPHPC